MVLAGTAPSKGPDTVPTPHTDVSALAGSKEPGVEVFQTLFFPKSRSGIAASEDLWAGIHERNKAMRTHGEQEAEYLSHGYLDGAVGLKAEVNQAAAFGREETSSGSDGSYGRLSQVKIPVLVADGHVS